MNFIEDLLSSPVQNRESMIIEKVKQKISPTESIDKREFFFLFRTLLIPYFYMLIEELNIMQENGELTYLIIGSSAWFANFMTQMGKSQYDVADHEKVLKMLKSHIKNDEMTASILAQNWDISIYVDRENEDNVRSKLKSVLSNISKTMRKDRISTELKSSTGTEDLDLFPGTWMSLCVFDKIFEKYMLFRDDEKCGINYFTFFWLMIHPVNNLSNVYKKFVEPLMIRLPASVYTKSMEIEELVKESRRRPTSTRPDLDPEESLRRSTRVKKHRTMYFGGFKDVTEANYLNIYGLIMFSAFMDSKHIDRSLEKGLNIDDFRIRWVTETGVHRGEIYMKLIEIWKNAFSRDKNDPLFESEYQYGNILEALQNNAMKSFMEYDNSSKYDRIDNRMIEFYRGTMNTICIDLNLKMSRYRHPDIEKIQAFILGGDAFTRYIDKSGTSDIDIKILVTPKVSTSNEWMDDDVHKDVQDIIMSVLSKYIIFLNYTLKFAAVDTKFRLRDRAELDEKFKGTKYHLFSIDVRTIHNLVLTAPSGQNYDLNGFKHDLAILDVAINYDNERYYADSNPVMMIVVPTPKFQCTYLDIVPDSNFHKYMELPMASPEFLMKEMVKRYNIPGKLMTRFLQGMPKIQKDLVRYSTLKSISHGTQYNAINNVVDVFILSTLVQDTKETEAIRYYGNLYKDYHVLKKEQKIERMREEKETSTSGKNFNLPYSLIVFLLIV